MGAEIFCFLSLGCPPHPRPPFLGSLGSILCTIRDALHCYYSSPNLYLHILKILTIQPDVLVIVPFLMLLKAVYANTHLAGSMTSLCWFHPGQKQTVWTIHEHWAVSLKVKVRLRPVGFPWLDSYRDTWECGHGLDIQPRSALLCLQPLEDQIVKCLLQDSLSSLNLSVINDLVTVYCISCGFGQNNRSHSRYFE